MKANLVGEAEGLGGKRLQRRGEVDLFRSVCGGQPGARFRKACGTGISIQIQGHHYTLVPAGGIASTRGYGFRLTLRQSVCAIGIRPKRPITKDSTAAIGRRDGGACR